MYKILLLLVFPFSSFIAQDSTDTLYKLSQIQQQYIHYIDSLSSSNPAILDPVMKNLPNTFAPVIFDQEYTLTPYELSLPQSLSTSSLSLEDKRYYAEIDQAKINVSLFMISALEVFYEKPRQSDLTNQYRTLFLSSENKLLSLAQKALSAPRERAEILSTEFNLIVQQLSRIPFPPQYSYYRRRRAYSLDTPGAAQQEITRITESLTVNTVFSE